MKATLKILVRAIGTVAGCIGLFHLVFLLAVFRDMPDWGVILAGLFFGLLAVYLLYVAYLVWRRLSPLAVQHVCFLLALVLFGVLTKCFVPELIPSPDVESPARRLSIYGGCILGAFVFYRACCFGLERVLFGAAKENAESGKGE